MTTGDGEAVAGDAFFGVVRRRHPDLDIVLLPPQPPEEPPAERVRAADLVDVPARFDAELTELLGDVAAGIPLPRVRSRWTPGAVTGSVAREALVAAEGVDAVAATRALAAAERSLTGAGWHVLAPGDGLPRVLAGRGGTEEEPLRREVQVVHVEARGRYAVTYRCGSYLVGTGTARGLLGERP
ncbi:hypothetical protein KRR39_19545 [Nocardioides panacis]|uniref:Uncharacterized protein n=1 Tax=Nocardioides panacis TaxID=2849501 RepID=A0A975XZT1_9ACTN|nr:hypothetical protein [Nocardioides panacis]QWZ07594.1 hypothetical protein KRR39_19545 [Nocardioides panacis]